jgi:hypothetical protein
MRMSKSVGDATDSIYSSLHADNADLDAHIATLREALARAGLKEAVFDPARLAQGNRSGRKLTVMRRVDLSAKHSDSRLLAGMANVSAFGAGE